MAGVLKRIIEYKIHNILFLTIMYRLFKSVLEYKNKRIREWHQLVS